MMGQEGVADDVRALWFEVCSEHVKDHVPQGVQELQAAVTKAGEGLCVLVCVCVCV
jgi:hypothetical protein